MMNASSPSDELPKRPRWPWALLAIALLVAGLARIPLVLNAGRHLDSDLAVDGLTLRDALHGQWRWHYPGTPFIGTLPVLFSWPQAALWSANPITLVSAGAIGYEIFVLATFLLGWRAFGPTVAAWSLVPLAFSSTGSIWLSGRVTGGHIWAAAWHAGAFLGLHATLSRAGRKHAAALGAWCGFGVFVDSMFLVTLTGLLPAAVDGWWASGRSRKAATCAAWFLVGFLVGMSPREVGAMLDPHDAYREQFRPILDRGVLEEHARILLRDCLPRLIAGHRLPGLQADPDPQALSGPGPTRGPGDTHPLAFVETTLALGLCVASFGCLLYHATASRDVAGRAVLRGLLLSSGSTVAAFVLNANIFNSDNYRYLVTLLVAWCLGFGLLMRGLARRGQGGFAAALLASLLLAGLVTIDSARWYARFGWVDARGWPVRTPQDDPVLDWLARHREVERILGDYWDVYRLAFLAGGRIEGIPHRRFPDRFQAWSRPWPADRRTAMIVRPTPEGGADLAAGLARGGRVVHRGRGFLVVTWP